MSQYTGNNTKQPVVLNALENHGPFVESLAEKDIVTAKRLIDEMHHPDMRDEHDRTSLMYAVLKECDEVLHYLFSKKADPLIRDQEGYTVLHRAAQMGNVKHVELVIKHAIALGVNLPDFLEIRSCRGLTALCSAAVLGYVDVVVMLIGYGASPEVKNYDGYSVLMTLAIKGHANVIRLLLTHANSADGKPYTLDVNEVNAKGWSALHFASYHNQHGAAAALIEYGADVNLPEHLGMTPLMLAAKCEMAIFLISHGAYVNKTTEEGESALTRALKNQQEKLLTLLINQHANLLDEKVQSACSRDLPVNLHELYIQERDEQTVAFQLLTMKHINDIKVAYDEAKQQDNHYLMGAIRRWLGGQKAKLIRACKAQDLFAMSELLHKGVDPLRCIHWYVNSVLYATLTNRPAVVELLLEYVDRERLNRVTKLCLKLFGYSKELSDTADLLEKPSEVSSLSFPQSVLSIENDVSHPCELTEVASDNPQLQQYVSNSVKVTVN